MSVKTKIIAIGLLVAVVVAIAVLGIKKGIFSSDIGKAKDAKINYRLPGDIVPTLYDLRLNLNVDTGLSTGQVIISLKIIKTTQQIIIHSCGLGINNVYILGADSTNKVSSFTLDAVREFLVINLAEKIVAGSSNVKIKILFAGRMSDSVEGLYKSSYRKEDGTLKTIATSQFQATHARHAFPCFDEPAMKANFSVTLVHPSNQNNHALSNMNIKSTQVVGDSIEVQFQTSVPMSTYLACFILSDFSSQEKQVNTGGIGKEFPMRVFATPQQISKVAFALDCGSKITEYYIKYFQVAYPLPKLDMVAIPDFAEGAMENWGLVTYRETALLYDTATGSTIDKQFVAIVVAHELAHMWFGNLVTMKWWNDLWLNEGFANYIEQKGVNSVFPEWKMDDQFIADTLHEVLSLDGTLGSHPIIRTVETPDQIAEIFDIISYSKGSSIIRMLEDFLTPPVFIKAVTNYLNKYKFSNAVTQDFLMELDVLVLSINVTEILHTWTKQMGLPVVNVQKLSATQYKLTQKRFFSNPEDYDKKYSDSPTFNYRWSIPITFYTSASNTVERRWFFYNQSDLTITVPDSVKWIKFNKNQVGYYRVNYPAEMWKALVAQLVEDPSVFSIGDRASLLNDAFSLADSTQLPFDTALDITTYLEKEVDYVPWNVASSELIFLKDILMTTDIFSKYITYARKLITKAYEEVGWTVGEDHLKNQLRIIAIEAACSFGLEACNTQAVNSFNQWLSNPSTRPHPDLRESIYYFGMMNSGTEKAWKQVWDMFVREQDANEKLKLMYGLSGIQVPWILSRYIQLAWNESNVRGQDYTTCLEYIAINPVGRNIVWDYIRENWQKLVARFGLNGLFLGEMIVSITENFETQEKLEQMQAFFKKYPVAGSGTISRLQALETVKFNIKWLKENKNKVGVWLEKQKNLDASL